MSMEGVHCECDGDPILRGRHDRTPCPIHGQKGKAAWDRLEAAASTLQAIQRQAEEARSTERGLITRAQAAEAERDEAIRARKVAVQFQADRIADIEHWEGRASSAEAREDALRKLLAEFESAPDTTPVAWFRAHAAASLLSTQEPTR